MTRITPLEAISLGATVVVASPAFGFLVLPLLVGNSLQGFTRDHPDLGGLWFICSLLAPIATFAAFVVAALSSFSRRIRPAVKLACWAIFLATVPATWKSLEVTVGRYSSDLPTSTGRVVVPELLDMGSSRLRERSSRTGRVNQTS